MMVSDEDAPGTYQRVFCLKIPLARVGSDGKLYAWRTTTRITR
jgi:hypothetical protein